MSLLRPETLHIGLAPGGVSAVKLAGHGRREVLAATTSSGLLDQETLDPRELFACLQVPELRAPQAVFVLADEWVRYFVVEMPGGLRNEAELQDVTISRFEEQYGLPADQWSISCDLQLEGVFRFACAVPRKLIEGIHNYCTEAKIRPKRIVPFTVGEINRWCSKFPMQPFWFAAASPNAVTLGYHAVEGWQRIKTHVQSEVALLPLRELAQRDGLRFGLEKTPLFYYAGWVGARASFNEGDGVDFLGAPLWPGQSTAWSREYRMALSGVWQ